jgi:hypothetical protein
VTGCCKAKSIIASNAGRMPVVVIQVPLNNSCGFVRASLRIVCKCTHSNNFLVTHSPSNSAGPNGGVPQQALGPRAPRHGIRLSSWHPASEAGNKHCKKGAVQPLLAPLAGAITQQLYLDCKVASRGMLSVATTGGHNTKLHTQQKGLHSAYQTDAIMA